MNAPRQTAPSRRLRRFGAPMCLATVLFCFAPTAVLAVGRPQAHRAHGHLYVVSFAFGTLGVYRFPLNADGLPAKNTDGALTGGLQQPLSVDFDGTGYMYVTDLEPSREVKVYAPGATGDTQPVRVISVPGEPEWLAVDAAGYLYVTQGYQSIDVFAPGAGPSSLPVNVINMPNHDFIFDLTLDSAGELYTPDDCGKIYLFKHPIYEQTPDVTFTRAGCYAWPITVDREQSFLYSRLSGFGRPWDASEYQALNLDFSPIQHGARSSGQQLYFSKDCWEGGSSGTFEYGLAVNTNYFMFSCITPSAVFVYRNLPGRRNLIESLAPTGMGNPAGIIFGP